VESAERGKQTSTDELALTADGERSTRVILTKRRVPVELIAAYAVGTQIHAENLAAHLDGRGPVDPDPFWSALLPEYELLAGDPWPPPPEVHTPALAVPPCLTSRGCPYRPTHER
jgi:hypothetical protein